MLKHILIAHDGSDGADRAFDTALELASQLHATLHMVSVEEDLPPHAQTLDELDDQKATEDGYFAQLGAQCRRRAAEQGVTFTAGILAGHEVTAIVEFARAGDFQLLVLGFTGHSRIYEHIWGGTSQNLSRLSPCSVLLVK
jgi:nucleotide-binding universal stress UspA family protein